MQHILEQYLKEKYPSIETYLRFGRLPVHELLKIECAKFGEELGYQVKTEYRVDRNKRIDVVWLRYGELYTVIEIDEGINKRALWKMNFSGAKVKICVFFDVKKMALKTIGKFNFDDFIVIQLCPRGNQERDNK